MAKGTDRHNEGESPLKLFDAHTINATSNDTSNAFYTKRSTFFTVEWEVTDAVDSDANFDLILQLGAHDGTVIDDDAGGANNADLDGISTILTAETSTRGVRSFTLPYWDGPLYFRINNDDNDNAAFDLVLRRDAYTRRK